MLACMGEVAAPIYVVTQDYHEFFKRCHCLRKAPNYINYSRIIFQIIRNPIPITCTAIRAFVIGPERCVVVTTYS